LANLTRHLDSIQENTRLRFSIIATYYHKCFHPQDAVKAIVEFINFPDVDTIYGIWDFHKTISQEDLPIILDGFSSLKTPEAYKYDYFVVNLYHKLLFAALQNSTVYEPKRIWTWLRGFMHFRQPGYGFNRYQDVIDWFLANDNLVIEIFQRQFLIM